MSTQSLAIAAVIALGVVYTAFVVVFGMAAMALTPFVILPLLPLGVLIYVLVRLLQLPADGEDAELSRPEDRLEDSH